MPATSTAAKANILATRRASCNTGIREIQRGALTIIYPKGGDYIIETAHQRHIREYIAHAQAIRAAAAFAAGNYSIVHNVATAIGDAGAAAFEAAQAADEFAKAIAKAKPKRKASRRS